jgi:hypothetical protein
MKEMTHIEQCQKEVDDAHKAINALMRMKKELVRKYSGIEVPEELSIPVSTNIAMFGIDFPHVDVISHSGEHLKWRYDDTRVGVEHLLKLVHNNYNRLKSEQL